MSSCTSSVEVSGPIESRLGLLCVCVRLVLIEILDLRLTSTVPLNFTKSINLTLSERGITALKQSGRTTAVDVLLNNAVPLRGRMIHRRSASGHLWEAEHPYDVHGRVRPMPHALSPGQGPSVSVFDFRLISD